MMGCDISDDTIRAGVVQDCYLVRIVLAYVLEPV